MEEKKAQCSHCPNSPGGVQADDGKATLVIQGEPEALEALMKKILEVADTADQMGLRDEADGLTAMLSHVKVMKAAQYEGFQNYWVANGRAFELAWKKKMEGKPEDRQSYQRAWAEVLEEFNESLLGNQADFISKAMKKAQYEGPNSHWIANSRAFELAFKKKLEGQKEDDRPSFHKAWMETLEDFQKLHEVEDEKKRQDFIDKNLKTASKQDFSSKMLSEATRKKISLAALYQQWEDCHIQALKTFAGAVSVKVANGTAPGVAFYETLEHFKSGGHAKDTMGRLISLAARLSAKGLSKESAFGDFFREMWQGFQDVAAPGKQWQTIKQMDKLIPRVQRIEQQYDQLFAAGQRLDPGMIQNQLQFFLGPAQQILANVKDLDPDLKSINLIEFKTETDPKTKETTTAKDAKGNPIRYCPVEFCEGGKLVTPRGWENYKAQLKKTVLSLVSLSRMADKGVKPVGEELSAPPGATGPVEMLKGQVDFSLRDLSNSLSRYVSPGKTIDFSSVSSVDWTKMFEEMEKWGQVFPGGRGLTDPQFSAAIVNNMKNQFEASIQNALTKVVEPPQTGPQAKEAWKYLFKEIGDAGAQFSQVVWMILQQEIARMGGTVSEMPMVGAPRRR